MCALPLGLSPSISLVCFLWSMCICTVAQRANLSSTHFIHLHRKPPLEASRAASPSGAKTSSLIFSETCGSVQLENSGTEPQHGQSKDTRATWRFPDRVSYDQGALYNASSSPVCVFPDSGRHALPRIDRMHTHDRALYGLAFLQRYHTDIQVPSRLLASTVLEDAGDKARQEKHGEELVGCTLAVLSAPDQEGALLLASVGGASRTELYLSTLTQDAGFSVTAAIGPCFSTTSPIVQISAYPADPSSSRLLVRTWTTTFLGAVQSTRSGDARLYKFEILSRVHTGIHLDARVRDACFDYHCDSRTWTVDSYGTVQLWGGDTSARETVRMTSGEDAPMHDAFWNVTTTGANTLLSASSHAVFHADSRTRGCETLAHTAHSANTLQRAVNTSLQRLQSTDQEHVFSLCTTDYVHLYDLRNTRRPVVSWLHGRGFDRTLSLVPLQRPSAPRNCVLLASQRNRLLTLYSAELRSAAPLTQLDDATYAPSSLPSAVPPNIGHSSPSPPCVVETGRFSGWEGLGPALLVEQTSLGSVWLRTLQDATEELGDSTNVHVHWPPETQRLAVESQAVEDAGPFGDCEAWHLDFRLVYQALMLGWLGTPDPDTLEQSTPQLIEALERHTRESAPSSPRTLMDQLYALCVSGEKSQVPTSQMHIPILPNLRSQQAASTLRQRLDHLLSRMHRNQVHTLFQTATGSPIPHRRIQDVYSELVHSCDVSGEEQDREPVREAAEQEAADVLFTSLVLGNDQRRDASGHGDKISPKTSLATNENWRWNGAGPPQCPAAEELDTLERDTRLMSRHPAPPLSVAAKLLLSEWDPGTSPFEYQYRDPYQDLDFAAPPEAQSTASTPRALPREPVRPIVGRASRPQIASSPALFASQPAAEPSRIPSSQETLTSPSRTDAFPHVQSQLEPGRFAQRPSRQLPKRRKRVGGF